MDSSISATDPDRIRIGTTEREASTACLGEHFAEGRLSTEEYELRVTGALGAWTAADLRGLFADLPLPRPPFLMPPAPPYQPIAPVYQGYPAYPPPLLPQPPRSQRSKVVAGLLQVFLPFGIGRFYTGQIGLGLLQLLLPFVTFGLGVLVSIVDGILLLIRGGLDGRGLKLRD
jgi:TM2 domain-containing membrane protein YozV